MMNNTTQYQAAHNTFPALCAEVNKAADLSNVQKAFYIKHGHYAHWNEQNRRPSNNGLKQWSTSCRWQQYQDGQISREKAVELAVKRMEKDTEKTRQQRLARLETVANAPELSDTSVYVRWVRSNVWNYNPHAEVYSNSGYTTGKASGCGYDKRSAAVAEAFNNNPSVLRVLYMAAEKVLERGESPASKTASTGYSWGACIGYGAGYSVLPYFEGGVGVSCFWSILRAAGYDVKEDERGKLQDYYYISKP